MKLLDNLLITIQDYYIHRNRDALMACVLLLQEEMDTPFLQEGTIELKTIRLEDAEGIIEKERCLILYREDYEAWEEIFSGKEIRVIPLGCKKEECLVLYVSHNDGTLLVLTPSGGGT